MVPIEIIYVTTEKLAKKYTLVFLENNLFAVKDEKLIYLFSRDQDIYWKRDLHEKYPSTSDFLCEFSFRSSFVSIFIYRQF